MYWLVSYMVSSQSVVYLYIMSKERKSINSLHIIITNAESLISCLFVSHVFNVNFNLPKNVPWSVARLVGASELADEPAIFHI